MAAEGMPKTSDREPIGVAEYVESDKDWCARHPEAVTWFIDNHEEIRRAMAMADR